MSQDGPKKIRNAKSAQHGPAKRKIVAGLLAVRDDKPVTGKDEPPNGWGPTIEMIKHFKPDHYCLIYQEKTKESERKNHLRLAEAVKKKVEELQLETVIELVPIRFGDPWDFKAVFPALYRFVEERSFFRNDDTEERYVHFTPGSDVAKACWAFLVFNRFFRGKLIQLRVEEKKTHFIEVDPNLENYKEISSLFKIGLENDEKILKLGVKTKNRLYNDMISELERIATKATPSDPILLLGETGVGKTVLAKSISETARFKDKEFKQINCATLDTRLVRSELFGHAKGAFTGADRDQEGLFGTAEGVLFFDEIGELDLSIQAMLLKVIDERTFQRVGEIDKPLKKAGYRLLVCGTNRDLSKMVSEGKFRADLLARIDTFSYTIPRLADRCEDIEPLVEHFLKKNSNDTVPPVVFSGPPLMHFLKFARSKKAPWKANLRDLNKIVRRMAMFSEEGIITQRVVEKEIDKLKKEWGHPMSNEQKQKDANRKFLVELIGEEKVGEIDDIDLVQLLHIIGVCRKSKTCKEAGELLYNHSFDKNPGKNCGDYLKKHLERFELSFSRINGFPRQDISER